MTAAVDTRPIIVGGCVRSGTSLVRRILDSHPHIYCGPEVKFLADYNNKYLRDPIRHIRFTKTALSMLPEEEVFELLGGTFIEMHRRAAARAGKRRWADKVPENVIFLDQWQRLLGDGWLFVHVVRHPLDTLASIKEQRFPATVPAELDQRIDLWLDYLRAGLRFAQQSPDRYVRVVYEDLATDPEAAAGAMMRALGEELDSDQLVLDNRRHQTGVEDPKIAQSQTIHRDSVDRWRRTLSRKEIKVITARAVPVWDELVADGRR